MSRTNVIVSAASLALALGGLAGCASGGRGGGLDAGRRDAHVPGVDAPFVGTDAPFVGTDAPFVGTDAPFVGTDAPAPRPDTGVLGCTSSASCDDGNACNGTETCVGGMCRAGTALTCDDRVTCTRDTCSGGTCVFTPDSTLCATGSTCTSTGCVGGGACTETPCRLLPPQCGCPSGQACYLSGGVAGCFASGTTPIGSACTGVSQCVPGGACINFTVGATPEQMCVRLCGADSDCGGSSLCVGQLSDGMGGALASPRTCSTTCNPATQSGCRSGLRCSVFQERAGAMRVFTDCTDALGTRTQSLPCTTEDDCGAGYACLDADGDLLNECVHWCNVATGTGCLGLDTCYGFRTPVVVGGTEYGVCWF